jgi:hypothetical protein
MNETDARPRRSLVVVLLDGVLRLFALLQAGPTPKPKVKDKQDGRRFGAGRYALLIGVLAALAGTALLVVVLVRAPGDPTPPPDPAAALPGLRSRPAGTRAAAGAATPGTSAPGSPSGTSATAKAATASQTVPTSPVVTSSVDVPGSPGITENTAVPLTATYKTASVTAGLLGYRMTVTVANPGPAAKVTWLLAVTLPRPTLLISGVKGATASQNGSVWTFTPDPTTSTVPAGGTVQISFGVHGATLIDAAPRDCRIDGNPCGV